MDSYNRNKITNNIHYFKRIDSTQELAKRILKKKSLKTPLTLVADEQTKGHGRHGRDFYSPPTTGLYFSIILPNWKKNLSKNELLTIDIAVVISKVLENFFPDKSFKLKWVNDIYLKGFKVAGIITDVYPNSNGSLNLIIGVGINLSTAQFPNYLSYKAIGINTKSTVDQNKLLIQIIKKIIKYYYSKKHFLNDYRKRSLILGKNITIQLGNKTIESIAQKIENNGYLTVKEKNGNLKTFSAGEIIRVRLNKH